ncbi:helix-turn-helix domain-containing protein [Streptomyces sp. NPDC002221]|uniref:helix-turn-helix domain-containing protein n=1 Tax=Streptomyces sp. NPDC002221 TaxID=3364639 RepID=UPI00367BD6FC
MGRPEKQLPLDIPLSQRSLAEEMRALRKSSGLTVGELSARIMYSAAAISQGTSGKTVPSLELVEAFVQGCGYTGDMEVWRRAHREARRDSSRETPSPAVADPGDGSVPLLTRVPRARRQRRTEEAAPPLHADGLLALVQQARKYELKDKRVTSVTSSDYMHTALALCTTAEDVLELMNELIRSKGISLTELERKSASLYQISNTTFTHLLGGTTLPTTELLHIFLAGCGVDADRMVMWHFTVTRIRISEMRQRERKAAGPRGGAGKDTLGRRLVTFFLAAPAAVVCVSFLAGAILK